MILVNVSCGVLLVLSLVLWVLKKYQDGILGRAGLMGMIFTTLLLLCEQAWGGVRYEIDPLLVMLIVSFALFLVHHTYRYLRFYHWPVVEHRTGDAGAMHDQKKAVAR